MFNTNSVHNFLNVAIAVIGIVATVLLAFGCTQLPTGAFDCSTAISLPAWLNPAWLTALGGALGVIKLVINATRDGLSGMIKDQPPVADTVTTIVVPAGKSETVEVKKTKG